MRRPIVKEEIVEFMRTRQTQNTGFLKELEDFAHKENIPIIPHETVACASCFGFSINASIWSIVSSSPITWDSASAYLRS